jgi:hypothetical protein
MGSLPPEGTRIELPRLTVTIRRTSRKRIKELVLQKMTCVEDQTDTAAA